VIGQVISGDAGEGSSSGTLSVSLCSNGVGIPCGGCFHPGSCFARTATNKVCDGLFNNSIGLPNGQGVQLNYIDGDFGYSTKVILYCDPTSARWTNIIISLGFSEDTVEAHGFAACPVGTVFVPMTASPSYPQSDNYTFCGQPLVASSGHTYDISNLIGTKISSTMPNNEAYEITVCASAISKCGLCDSSGFCERMEWFDNCVGQFSSAVPNADGSGITLYYPNGEFSRSGILYLMCGPSRGPNATITSGGNVATFYTPMACPMNSTLIPTPEESINGNPPPLSTYNLLMAIGLAVGVALLITLVILAIVYITRRGRAGYAPIGNQ